MTITKRTRPLRGLAVDSPPPARSRPSATKKRNPCQAAARPAALRFAPGSGKTRGKARAQRVPPRTSHWSRALQSRSPINGRLSALALGRPLLGRPLHNRHYANLSRVSQSTTMCRLHPSAPSKGAPPGAHHRKERAASSARRTATSTVSRLGAQAAAAPRLPRLRSKPRDSVLRGDFEGLQPAGARFRPGDARVSPLRNGRRSPQLQSMDEISRSG